jgi:hypothetical protein
MRAKQLIIGLLCSALCILNACRTDRTQMQLDGECEIVALSMDDFDAVLDSATATAKVMLPKGYSRDALTLTRLEVSEGATANYAVGQVFNLHEAKRIVVINGDVRRNWTLCAFNEEAEITYFDLNGLYPGIINQDTKTIVVTVPAGVSVSSMRPTIITSEGATVEPQSGVLLNFENPVVFTVTSEHLVNQYTVTVKQVGNPKALFVGNAASMDQLQPEEQAACTWMMTHIDEALYASLEEVRTGKYKLDECRIIFWHMHATVNIDNLSKFEANAPQAVAAVPAIQAYLNAGGNLLLTRYATFLPAYLSIGGQPATNKCPNNCWPGAKETEPEITKEAWGFSCKGHTGHPMFQNLLGDGDAEKVFTCDAGYGITNTTCQYRYGVDPATGEPGWWGLRDLDAFRTATGAVELAISGDPAVVVWEFPKNASCGGIICIGSGAYDWYNAGGTYTGYHKNVETMTLNAINYLIGQ